MKHFPILCALASLASCASNRPLVGPLEGASEVAVRYSSRVAGVPRAAEPIEAPAEEPGPAALVQVSCRLVEMDRAEARSMLGDGVRGLKTSRAVAEAAIGTLERGGDARLITAPGLVVFDGRRGDIQVATQHAYVEAFEITESEDAASGERSLIGDPIVALVSEGIQVEARPSVMVDGSTVQLEARLRTSSLLDAIAERTARLPGVGATVTVQQPLCFTQEVSTSVELGSESVLVIGGLPTAKADRVLVALVATRAAPPETALRIGEEILSAGAR